jgi:hypothetical protein
MRPPVAAETKIVDTRPRFAKLATGILWPSFLMAGVLEMLVFAVVDPSELHWFGGPPIELSRQAIYTLSFMIFWLVISLAGALTALLEESRSGPEPQATPTTSAAAGPPQGGARAQGPRRGPSVAPGRGAAGDAGSSASRPRS